MSKWFVVHDLLAYSQHPDMIGNRVKTPKTQQPKSATFAKIKKGDWAVYYATKDYVVVGIFQVVSEIEYLPNDQYWKEIMVYKIEPAIIPPLGNYLDFKKFILDPTVTLDLFPDKKNWGKNLQGKTCALLSERDYSAIKNAFSQSQYLRDSSKMKTTPTKWHKKYGKGEAEPKKLEGSTLHQQVIEKWKIEEEKKFGLFKPFIKTNTVDLNEILPKSIWLTENKKYVDAIARLEIGSQPIYQSILEVQHKGSKEDLCVRVSIILPFVTRIDIVSDKDSLPQIRELLERVADPNIVKSRVYFYSFQEALGW